MKVICSRCDATGFSKCPRIRNVFPEKQHVTCLRLQLSAELGIYREDWECSVADKATDLVITYTLAPNYRTKEQALIDLRDTLSELSNQDIKELCCAHDWQHTEDCMYCGYKHVEKGPE